MYRLCRHCPRHSPRPRCAARTDHRANPESYRSGDRLTDRISMEIEQSFTVPYPRDAVWACFHDTSGIVACLPGASLSAPPEGTLLKLAMQVKLGPIIAAFAGYGR